MPPLVQEAKKVLCDYSAAAAFDSIYALDAAGRLNDSQRRDARELGAAYCRNARHIAGERCIASGPAEIARWGVISCLSGTMTVEQMAEWIALDETAISEVNHLLLED